MWSGCSSRCPRVGGQGTAVTEVSCGQQGVGHHTYLTHFQCIGVGWGLPRGEQHGRRWATFGSAHAAMSRAGRRRYGDGERSRRAEMRGKGCEGRCRHCVLRQPQTVGEGWMVVSWQAYVHT